MDSRKDSAARSDAQRLERSGGTTTPNLFEYQGRCPSNTYPPTSHPLSTCPDGFASGGLDWLAYSFGVRWHDLRHARLMDLLDETKAKLQTSDDADGLCVLPDLGEVVLSRTGYRWGGTRGQLLDFKLRIDGIEVGLARRPGCHPNNANVVVKQTGRDCLLWGGREKYELMRQAIECLGCRIEWEKLSRVDLAIDLVGMPIETLQLPYENNQFITRCRSTNAFHNRVTETRSGFFAGRAPCYLTVYDKLHEVKKKQSIEYSIGMMDRRWGGEMPTAASRVEWQLHRTKLREFGVSTPKDFFDRQSAIYRKLMTGGFRLTNEVVDRVNNNQQRCTVLSVWQEITEAGASIFASESVDLTPLDRSKVKALTALRTARGHLKNVFYDRGLEIPDYETFMEAANRELMEIGNTEAEIVADQENFIRDYHKGFISRGLDDAA